MNSPQRRWFFGPVSDLAFGCGLIYGLLFVWQALAGSGLRTALPYSLLPLLTLLLGAPHYGATLLRVYQQRESRRKYAVFAVWITILLVVAYVAGIYSLAVGSALVTLYLTWSPWHYSGQNYGVALLFLRRRGVAFDRTTKRLIYGCFVLPYFMVFVALHGQTGSAQYAPGSYEGTLLHFMSLEIPLGAGGLLSGMLWIAYGICLVGAARRLSRGAAWRDLLPTAIVTLTQSLWFALPTLGSAWGLDPFRHEYRAYALMWVAVGHFLQYLWITTYYAAASERAAGRLRYLGRTLLAGSAVWFLPALLFAPGLLGRLPYDMGLGLVTASVVNLHHFVLDGAIWKLRDGRIARALLRSPDDAEASPAAAATAPRFAWASRALWATGALSFIVSLGLFVDDGLAGRARADDDLQRLSSVQARRRWLGRDSARTRLIVAREALAVGDADAAAENVERSLALHPTAEGYLVQARIARGRDDDRGAMRALHAALQLDPDNVEALLRSGLRWLRTGHLPEAQDSLQRAHRLDPDNPAIEAALQKLQAASASGPRASSASDRAPH